MFYFIFFLFFSSSLISFPTAQIATKEWKQELTQIDAEIEQVEDEQRKLQSAKARWTDTGMRWQFQQNMTQEAKRAFQNADACEERIQMNQKYLDALKRKRANILQEHPEANVP